MRFAAAIMIVGLTVYLSGCSASPPGAVAPAQRPVDVAAAYLEAMEANDLDAAQELFAAASSVFESGGDEGDWAHYRESHLGPEIDAITDFAVTRGEPGEVVSRDASMAVVTWPIEYRIELADGRVIDSRGTVTFVLVAEQDRYRIRHLHWSSRKVQ